MEYLAKGFLVVSGKNVKTAKVLARMMHISMIIRLKFGLYNLKIFTIFFSEIKF